MNEKTVAAIALKSGGYKDLQATLADAVPCLELASAQGVQLAVLPETINLYHRTDDSTPLEDFALEDWQEATAALCETAARCRISLVFPCIRALARMTLPPKAWPIDW